MEQFLKESKLSYLMDYFIEVPDLTVEKLSAMSDAELESVLQGDTIYISVIRQEVERYLLQNESLFSGIKFSEFKQKDIWIFIGIK